MASMTTCPCGWTIISPKGETDIVKHMRIHLSDSHPGTAMKDEEIMKTIRSL